MIRPGRSLYARLALRLAAVLCASSAILLAALWFSTRSSVDQAYDRLLSGSALQIAENIWYENGRVNVDLPLAAFAMLTPGDRVLYNVLGPDGRSVAGDPEFKPDIPWSKLADGPLVLDGRHGDLPLRIAVVGRRMPVAAGNPWAAVAVAQSRNARAAFMQGLAAKVLLVIAVTGVLTAVIGMFTLYQALAPLKAIEGAIQRRDLNDLAPLELAVPAELHAVVGAINAFMSRLAARRTIMQRVIANAAHQLRTPVTALISQVELLSGQQDDAARRHHLERLRVRAAALGALVNQLIQHAMVLHRTDAVARARLDLKTLARDEIAELLSHAPSRLDLELRAPDAACWIEADAVSVREAIRNVLANALRYGARSFLHVELADGGSRFELRFIDDGPGIPESEWGRVREPFAARSAGHDGASLGLAIVDEVMRAHGGALRFERVEGSHFAVILTFPKAAN